MRNPAVYHDKGKLLSDPGLSAIEFLGHMSLSALLGWWTTEQTVGVHRVDRWIVRLMRGGEKVG